MRTKYKERIAFVLLIAVIAIAILYGLMPVLTAKSRLSESYEKVEKPSTMTLKSSYWTPLLNIDTHPHWTYNYTSPNAKASLEELKKSAESSGYMIKGTFGGYVAIGKEKNVKFSMRGNNQTMTVQVFDASVKQDSP